METDLRQESNAELASATERAAKAEQAAAEANTLTEQERLARVKLQKELAGRRIWPEQAAILKGRLLRFSPQTLYVYNAIDHWETRFFAANLSGVVRGECGWEASECRAAAPSANLPIPGLHIFSTPDDKSQDAAIALFDALKEIGLMCNAYCPKLRRDLTDWRTFDHCWPYGLLSLEQTWVLAIVNEAPLPEYPR